MIRVGLLGHPVEHSRSPALHTAWFAQTGVAGHYIAHDVAPDTSGPDVLATLDRLGWTGANLTVPLKTRVLPYLAGITPRARAIGAVNTLVRRADGWHGRNTDVEGFTAELEGVGADPGSDRGTTIVLGAGGAARAVVAALCAAGAAEVVVLNRTAERVRTLIQDLRPLARTTDLQGGPLTRFPDVASRADRIANTTTGAARETIGHLEVGSLPPQCAWIDLNYWMDDPPWVHALEHRGHPVGTGHRMLVHQGAVAFEAFTGVAPDPAVGLAILGFTAPAPAQRD